MAAPYAAGIAALIRSAGLRLTVGEARDALSESALSISGAGGNAGLARLVVA
jgi:hypothetical protein